MFINSNFLFQLLLITNPRLNLIQAPVSFVQKHVFCSFLPIILELIGRKNQLQEFALQAFRFEVKFRAYPWFSSSCFDQPGTGVESYNDSTLADLKQTFFVFLDNSLVYL